MEVRLMALHYGHGLHFAPITRQMMLSTPAAPKPTSGMRDDVQKLSPLLDRDLGAWRRWY